MIGVKLNGRLGNQLFQFAFAYSTSKKLKTWFYLDTEVALLLDPYFNIPVPFLNRALKYLNFRGGKRLRFYILRFTKRNLKTVRYNDDVNPSVSIKTIANNTYYEGFFQSRAFFREHEKQIVQFFTIKKKFKINVPDHFDPACVSVLLHVRRTDYFNTYFEELNTGDISIPATYFLNALEYLTSLIKESYKIYVISDDITYVKHEFKDAKYKLNFLENPYIVDFQLMMNADYLILSNSTFSWWGAFLNKNAKEIVAPEYWCGISKHQYFPSGINTNLAWTWM